MKKVFVQALLVLGLAAAPGRAEDLAEFHSDAGRFKVLMPGKPPVTELKTPAGIMHVVQVETKTGAYLAGWIDLPLDAADTAEKAQARLDRARDGMIASIKGKLLREKKITLEDKHPGRDLLADVSAPDQGRLRGRLFLVENRLYQVIVVGTRGFTESEEADRVLDSFALTK